MNQGPQGAAPSAPPPFSPPPPTQPADTVGPPRVVVQRQPPQPAPRPRDEDEEQDSPPNQGGITWGKLFLALILFLIIFLALIYWIIPWFSDDGDKGINGNLAGQAQGAPGPTSSGGGSGPQPTTSPPPNNPSPSTPLNNGGAKNDLLSDSERLSGGPCTGSAVDRMTYYFLGTSKEDGQIKVGTWCSSELIADPNQQLAVLQTAQALGGTQELTKLLSTIHLHRLSRRYPGKETVLIKDGRQHTLVDPLIIPINGTGTNALQDVCAQFKEYPGDKATPQQLWLWQQCQSNLAAKPTNVQNTVITMGNYVTRPEFDAERSYTRAEIKRLQDAINAKGAPLPPAEVKRLLNPHSQEEANTPTPPR